MPADLYEVVVVDHYGKADWCAAHDEFQPTQPGAPIRYERVEGMGRARALNRGLDLARGDLVVFLADDFIPRVPRPLL